MVLAGSVRCMGDRHSEGERGAKRGFDAFFDPWPPSLHITYNVCEDADLRGNISCGPIRIGDCQASQYARF